MREKALLTALGFEARQQKWNKAGFREARYPSTASRAKGATGRMREALPAHCDVVESGSTLHPGKGLEIGSRIGRIARRFAGLIFLLVIAASAKADESSERWRVADGFSLGVYCGYSLSDPNSESEFSVKKLRASESISDMASPEFRLFKPSSEHDSAENLAGSNFSVAIDREDGEAVAVRFHFFFSIDGACRSIIREQDGAPIELLRGRNGLRIPPTKKVQNWIDRAVAQCERRVERGSAHDDLFDCVRFDPAIEDLGVGVPILVGPKGFVPASVARVYFRSRGEVFAVTAYGKHIELLKVEE